MAIQFHRTACQSKQRLSQATVLAMTNDPGQITTNNPLINSAAAPRANFLASLSLDRWEILSFDPLNREVCIALYSFDTFGNRTTYRVMDITLPSLGK